LACGVVQDRFRSFRNLRSIESTEDLNLGWEGSVAAGWSAPALGADREALLLDGSLKRATALGDHLVLAGEAGGRGRIEGGAARDARVEARFSVYATGLPFQTVAVDLTATLGRRPDPENVLYIGGFDGLRGYPTHYRAGESRWLLTAEERVITPWRLWGIAQVGFVAYAEAGAVERPGRGWTRTYADVGAGLRFGNLKGTVNRVVTLTVSAPLAHEPGLPSWQVVAGETLPF
jgi:hypothetical protein